MARASIRQVAEAAGVSTMTVSRVLHGKGGSQHEERVLSAVRELDYVPVRSAMQNRHVKTNIIGVLLDDEFTFETPIGQQTFDGLRRAAFAGGYDLLMLHPQHQLPLEKQKIQFLDRRCDGFIFVVPFESSEILELLVQHQFPAVTCYSNDVPDGIAHVVPDNAATIARAVALLRQHGHERIGFWSGGQRHSDARERAATYQSAMREANVESFCFDSPFDTAQPLDAAQAVLEPVIRGRISAVVCHNDDRAIALWDAALERGLEIPRDFSIIGIDDMPVAATYGLTTFANPFFNIGATAVASMISLLQGVDAPATCQKLPMTLRERGSVASPSGSFEGPK